MPESVSPFLMVYEVDFDADEDFFFVVVERRLDDELELVPWEDFQLE